MAQRNDVHRRCPRAVRRGHRYPMVLSECPPQAFLIPTDRTGVLPILFHKLTLFIGECARQAKQPSTTPLVFDPSIARMGRMPCSRLGIFFLRILLIALTTPLVFLLAAFFNRYENRFRIVTSIGIDFFAMLFRISRSIIGTFLPFAFYASRCFSVFGVFVYPKFFNRFQRSTASTDFGFGHNTSLFLSSGIVSRKFFFMFSIIRALVRLRTCATFRRFTRFSALFRREFVQRFRDATFSADLGFRSIHGWSPIRPEWTCTGLQSV